MIADSNLALTPEPIPLMDYAQQALRQSSCAQKMQRSFHGRSEAHIVDILDGDGDIIMLLAPLLPLTQVWTFCNDDRARTMLMVGKLAQWADSASMENGAVVLKKGARTLLIHLLHVRPDQLKSFLNAPVDLVVMGGQSGGHSDKICAGLVKLTLRLKAHFMALDPWPMRLNWSGGHMEDAAVLSVFQDAHCAQHGNRQRGAEGVTPLLANGFADKGYGVAHETVSAIIPNGMDGGAYSALTSEIERVVLGCGRIPPLILNDWLAQRRSEREVEAHYRFLYAEPIAG